MSPSPGEVLFRLLAGKKPFYVVSHERSGTHFAINNLFRNAYVRPRLQYVGDWLGPYESPETRYQHLEKFRADWPSLKLGGGIVKTHAQSGLFRRWYPAAPVVYVLRDPRDTLVSFYHYLNSDELHATNPGLDSQRCPDFAEFLRRPLSDYLRDGFCDEPHFGNVAGRWASHVAGWMREPGVCVVRYEDLLRDYRACVRKVCRSVGLFPRLCHSPVGLHDAASVLPRRGTAGEGRTVFSSQDEEFLRLEMAGHGLEFAECEPFSVRLRSFASHGR